MMTDDIQRALAKGKSPVTLGEVVEAAWAGNLCFYVGKHMTASCWDRDGVSEIVHLTGKWDDQEARAMWVTFRKFALSRDKPWGFHGRKGWLRFLQAKGFRS